nr:GIY-YIG nuclease family protein [Gammaproteobacteria bacterium]
MKVTQEERLKSLKKYVNRLTTKPGIYMMLNSNDVVIYVGKAKNLKNRVSSYFNHNKTTS